MVSVYFQPVESWQSSLSKPQVLKVFKTNGGGPFPAQLSLPSRWTPPRDCHVLTSFPSASLLARFLGCGWAPSGLPSGAQSSPGSPRGCALSSPACSQYWTPVQAGEHQEAVPFPPMPSTCRSPLLPNWELLTEKQTQLSLIDNQAEDSNFIYFH